MDNRVKTVALGVIAYNEHSYLPALLSDILEQTYPHDQIQVILVDGESTDDTRQIMQDFMNQYSEEYREISILNNHKRIQPAGWNVVIQNSSSDILLRIDAHARLPKDFIEKNVACMNTGEFVCGGPRENIIDEDTLWKHMLLTAEQSMFGSGFASYRQETNQKKYVKSLFHGAYRKEVLEKVGLFNEDLVRTEDNEYHYRIRQFGYRICYDPLIHSYYQTRNSLRAMLKQKYQNGLWIGKTLYICPGCISLFHLVPCAFVFAILLSTVLLLFGVTWPVILMCCVYGFVNLVISVLSFVSAERKSIVFVVLPITFFLLHICYGVGTIIGVFSKR